MFFLSYIFIYISAKTNQSICLQSNFLKVLSACFYNSKHEQVRKT